MKDNDVAYIVKYSKASKDQINHLLEDFQSNHSDGRMCKPTFRKWLSTMDTKPTEKPDVDIGKLEDNIFGRFDRMGDEKIEFQDFLFTVYIMSSGTKQEKAERIFNLFDVDGDGELTKDEMGAVLRKVCKSEEAFDKVFDEMDANKDAEKDS